MKFVVKGDLTPLIGRKTAEKMRLITIDDNLVAGMDEVSEEHFKRNIVDKYEDAFGNSLETIPGKVYFVTKAQRDNKLQSSCEHTTATEQSVKDPGADESNQESFGTNTTC